VSHLASGGVSRGALASPVTSISPLGSTIAPLLAPPSASALGASMAVPFASRQTPGAKKRTPSSLRTNVHGENELPGGGTIQRPARHDQRLRRHAHSPSIHTASCDGASGTVSGRAGGGGNATSMRSACGCGEYGGCGRREAHAGSASAIKALATLT